MKREMAADAKQHFFEEMGLQFENMQMPRMAGRLLGWLLLCEPPHQTAAQLGAAIGASKGSLSSMLRLLVQRGIAEQLGMPGERARYYRLRKGAWQELIRKRLAFVCATRELAERGLELMRGADPEALTRMQEFYSLHAFLEQALPAVLDRYEQGAVYRSKEK